MNEEGGNSSIKNVSHHLACWMLISTLLNLNKKNLIKWEFWSIINQFWNLPAHLDNCSLCNLFHSKYKLLWSGFESEKPLIDFAQCYRPPHTSNINSIHFWQFLLFKIDDIRHLTCSANYSNSHQKKIFS